MSPIFHPYGVDIRLWLLDVDAGKRRGEGDVRAEDAPGIGCVNAYREAVNQLRRLVIHCFPMPEHVLRAKG